MTKDAPLELYHWSERRLDIGGVVEPGRWGQRVKDTGPREHPHFYREMVLELVRRFEFGDKPSRLAAAFVWVDLEMAKAARPEPGHRLYRVAEPERGLDLFDEIWIARLREAIGAGGLIECARGYWSGQVVELSRREGLTRGDLVVTEVIEEPLA